MNELTGYWEDLRIYLEKDQVWVVWMLGLSALTFLVSLIAIPIAIVRMDADFFVREHDPSFSLKPSLLLRRFVKNLVGWLVLLAGVAMLVLPGQGLLTMLLGICLLDFPGKRSLQLRIVGIRSIRRSMNWIRKIAEKPPLELPFR